MGIFNNDPWNKNGGSLGQSQPPIQANFQSAQALPPGGQAPAPPGGHTQVSGPSYTVDNQFKNDQGFQNRNTFGGVVGGADMNVNRYRAMGDNAAMQGAYQANYGGFNGSMGDAAGARGAQTDALALQRSAALGQQPSQAQLLGQQMQDRANQNAMSVAASSRGGPLAQANALAGAQTGLGAANQQAAQSQMAQRAAEMAQARDAYMGGASGIRAGDFQGAGLNLQQTGQDIQNQQFQRGLNQQNQQFYEGLGFQTNAAQLAANQAAQHEADALGQSNIQNSQQASDFDWQKAVQVTQAAAGAGSGGMGWLATGTGTTSDFAAKDFVTPMSGSGGPVQPAFAPNAFPNLTYSDERSKQETFPMGRTAPMGSLPPWMPPMAYPATTFLTSDSHAKTEQRLLGQAEGAQAAQDSGATVSPGLYATAPPPSMGDHAQMQWDASHPVSSANTAEAAKIHASFGEPPAGAPGPTPGQPTGAMGGIGAVLGGAVHGMHTYAPQQQYNPYFQPSDGDLKHGLSTLSNPFENAGESGQGGVGGFVSGTIKHENDIVQSGIKNQTGGAMAGTRIVSDPRAKQEAFEMGMKAGASAGSRIAEKEMGGARDPRVTGYTPGTFLTPDQREFLRDPYEGQPVTPRHFLPPKVREGMEPQYEPLQFPKEAGTVGARSADAPRGKATPPLPPGSYAAPPADAAPPARMMDAIGGGKTFKYKPGVPGTDPNAQQYGTTTQDLRQTPMGASMVTVDPRTGYEAIDTRQAVGPTLAALGNLNQRMRGLEEEHVRRRRGEK